MAWRAANVDICYNKKLLTWDLETESLATVRTLSTLCDHCPMCPAHTQTSCFPFPLSSSSSSSHRVERVRNKQRWEPIRALLWLFRRHESRQTDRQAAHPSSTLLLNEIIIVVLAILRHTHTHTRTQISYITEQWHLPLMMTAFGCCVCPLCTHRHWPLTSQWLTLWLTCDWPSWESSAMTLLLSSFSSPKTLTLAPSVYEQQRLCLLVCTITLPKQGLCHWFISFLLYFRMQKKGRGEWPELESLSSSDKWRRSKGKTVTVSVVPPLPLTTGTRSSQQFW